MRRRARPVSLGLALLTAACGDAGAPSLTTIVDSSAGFPVYRHSGTPERWSVELVATVGADTGGPFEFGAVTSVLLGARGSLYILDGSVRQLSAFDSLGGFVGRWGRRGRGPGEYVAPLSIAMLHDSVALYDRPNAGKIMVFSPEGTLAREWQVNAPTGEQDLILYRTAPLEFWTSTAFRQGAGIRRAFIRHSSAGATDTITASKQLVANFPLITCDAGGGGFTWYPVPFGPQPLARPLPGGEQAILINSTYRIAMVGRTGDTVRVMERDVSPGPIGDDEWEREVAAFRKWRATRGNPTCTRSTFDRPPARPIIEWMFVDDERHLWVESYGPEGSVYEVFGMDGSLVASVTGLPPSRGVDPSVAAGRIALYAPDSADVPRVLVYRIRKP